MVITVNLSKELFVHCILVVQDLFNERGSDTIDKRLQNLEYYIGNDPDYIKNMKCSGGPFMVVEDSENSFT